MSNGWSYTGRPQDSALDEVRFLIADTTETAQSLSDDEILYLISQQLPEINNYRAASNAAIMLGDKYAALAAKMKKIGDLMLETDYSLMAGRYEKMAHRLMKGRTQYAVGAPVMADDSAAIFAIGSMDDPNGGGAPTKTGYV